ncbi:MAG: hypothetical protein ACRCX2_30250 [Paraclostridium sp.]
MTDARWSRKGQLTDLILSPEQKWFFLDKNNLDGTFKIFDSQEVGKLQLGWGSQEIADGNGAFKAPYPVAEATFKEIVAGNRLVIVGNDKLNQYITLCDIQLMHNGTVKAEVKDVVITKVVDFITLPDWVDDVNKIRLTVKKVNVPNVSAKILETMLVVQIRTSDEGTIKLLEEVAIQNSFSLSDTFAIGLNEQGIVTNKLSSSDTDTINLSESKDITVTVHSEDILPLSTSYELKWTMPRVDLFFLSSKEQTNMENIHTVLRNPVRTVYAKVRIQYTELELDDTVKVTSSHVPVKNCQLENLYNGYRTAAHKYMFANEGNLYQDRRVMEELGPDVPVAFRLLSGLDGTLNEPLAITVTMKPRRILNLLLIGCDKLNEYPVDFIIRVYDNTGTKIYEKTVTGNDNVFWSESVNLKNVESIVYVITKINQSNVSPKIQEIFGAVTEEYESEDIVSIDILEEAMPLNREVSLGAMSANQLSLVLYNRDWKFSRNNKNSVVSGLLTANKKIQVWFGADVRGERHWEDMGTFFSGPWKVSGTSLDASVLANDRLTQMKDLHTLPVMTGVSYYTAFYAILQNGGVPAANIVVDDFFKDHILPYTWFPKGTPADCLHELGKSIPCYIYVDRKDTVNVIPRDKYYPESFTVYDRGDYYNYDVSVDDRQVVNDYHLTLNQYLTEDDTDLIDGTGSTSLLPNESRYVIYDFSNGPYYSNYRENIPEQTGVTITRVALASWGAIYHYVNNTSNPVLAGGITATGTVLVHYVDELTYRELDAVSVAEVGSKGWEYTTDLLQTEEQAKEIVRQVSFQHGTHRPVVMLDARGDFAVDVGQLVETEHPFDQAKFAKFRQLRTQHYWDGTYKANIELEYESESD